MGRRRHGGCGRGRARSRRLLLSAALGKNSDSEDDCDGNVCGDQGTKDRNDARSKGDTATWLGIAGGVLVAGGATLFIVGRSGSQRRERVGTLTAARRRRRSPRVRRTALHSLLIRNTDERLDDFDAFETPLARAGAGPAAPVLVLAAGCNAIFGIEEPIHSSDTGSGGTKNTGNGGSSAGKGGTFAGGGAGDSGDAGASSGGTLGDGGTNGGVNPNCGDGVLDTGERCDDENTEPDDGCSASCRVESGFTCDEGEPSHCTNICGDGLLVGPEAKAGGCDDENDESNDGCSASCKVETNYVCIGEPSECAETCGNSELDEGETCDDGNSDGGDGCDSCAIEDNFVCDNSSLPSTCTCKTGYTKVGDECLRTSCVDLTNKSRSARE